MWPFARYISAIPLVFLSFDFNFKGTVGLMNHRSSPSLAALFIVAWSTILKGVECASKEEVERHLELGKKFLAAGQMADALSQYHAAVEGDPSNYMTYFRRATVYLAMGKSKSAIPDLDKVIELKPDFVAARNQRGNVRLKQGKLDEAYMDYEQVLAKDRNNVVAQQHISYIEPLKMDIQRAANLKEDGDFQGAVDLLGYAIEHCPWDPNLREMRADCYMAQGDYFKAIGDIRPTTKLRNDNTAGYYKLSMLHYQMGEPDESLSEIRECLKLDPDHKDCFPHYKKVKKLVKQIQSIFSFINEQRWDDCLTKADQMITTEPVVLSYVNRAHSQICHCHSKAGHVKEALDTCGKILAQYADDIDALCDRAEAYIANEQYEKAIEDYKSAKNIVGDHQRAKDGLHRAEKLLKQSQKRDYYKILGVRRSAHKKEILKAYRKLAVQWHPDKYDGDDKKKAEKMFLDIASAKEVLTNPEKRQKFDNGEDPLDPEEQSSGHPHWHQGFNPFGGGGFQFKFHFG